MGRFVVRRLLSAIPLLFGVAVLSFIFAQIMPGGPDTLFGRGGRMTREQLDNIRQNMGLDQPLHEQLYRWLVNLMQGDLGMSYSQHRPVRDVIWEVFPNTVLLMSVGLMIAMILGAKSGAEFSPVPTAVPPSASSDTEGSVARTRRTVLVRICA